MDTKDAENGSKFLKWLDFFYENRLSFALGFSAILLFLSIIYIKTPNDQKLQKRLISTDALFDKWTNSPLDEELEKSLLALINKSPELCTKYDASIAQKYLFLDQPDKAKPFAQRAIARLKKDSPYFARFSENTLLISKHLFTDALDASLKLKESLTNDPSVAMDSTLYGLNLLRIADLQHSLSNREDELAILQEIEEFAGKTKILGRIFQENNINLHDYLSFRKEGLFL